MSRRVNPLPPMFALRPQVWLLILDDPLISFLLLSDLSSTGPHMVAV